MSETHLTITKDDSLSVRDLTELQAAGYSVLRSAHVGNLSPYNLTLAHAGIPILSVDHTITGVDRNYLPESLHTQEGETPVAPLGQLVCRTTTDLGYLDQVHLDAARQAVDGAVLFTNTEYIQANEAVIGEAVALALKEFPHYFDRMALADGTTIQEPRAAEYAKQYGIMQLNDEPRAEQMAVIMPNILDIVANFVVEALRTGEATQFHLSGPDMVNYVGRLVPELERFYARLRETASYGEQLPRQLTVRLVPTAAAKFATTKARQPRLDSLLLTVADAEAELAQLQARRKEFFAESAACDSTARQAFLQGVKGQEVAAERAVAEELADIPELLNEPGQPGFLTQYDLLQEGGLHVAKANVTMSMAQLGSLALRLRQIKERYPL